MNVLQEYKMVRHQRNSQNKEAFTLLNGLHQFFILFISMGYVLEYEHHCLV